MMWIELNQLRRLVGAWACLGAMCGACEVPGTAPQTGSETHFLMACESTCPSGLTCLCGTCTEPCSDDTSCRTLDDAAACVDVSREPACEQAMCDIACAEDEDCRRLGDGYLCDEGYCRGPVSETLIAESAACPGGSVAGADVLVIGDAYISLTALTNLIEVRAQSAGALGTDEHYRDYASSDTPFLTGSLTIASQYEVGAAEGPPKVVIMTGGAGDALLDCPDATDTNCPMMQSAAMGAQALLEQMASDGVEHVVYFFYPDPVDNDPVKARLDELRPLIDDLCQASSAPCHFLDLRPVFENNYAEYVSFDGLIFSEPGAEATADAVWQLMQRECIAP